MSIRTYAIEYLGARGDSSATGAGGDVLLDAPAHAHDGPSHTGLLPLGRISTTETDTTKVARPDGAGGIAFALDAESDAMVPYYIASGDMFTVPLYKQALFMVPIEVDGGLVVNGVLVGVD